MTNCQFSRLENILKKLFLLFFFNHLTTTPIQPPAYNWSVKDRADLPTCRLVDMLINYVFSQDASTFLVIALRWRVPPLNHFSSFKGGHPELDKTRICYIQGYMYKNLYKGYFLLTTLLANIFMESQVMGFNTRISRWNLLPCSMRMLWYKLAAAQHHMACAHCLPSGITGNKIELVRWDKSY